MFEHLLSYLATAQIFISRHPIQSVLGLGLLFAGSSAVWEAFLYWMARLGGRPLIHRYSRVLRVDPRKIDNVEGMFARWGGGLVFFGRFIPGIKILVPVPAGMSRMNFGLYLGTTFSAAYIYNIFWLGAALFLGHKITMFGVHIW
jgi:membrane protein DedA with SNARE-associated domain